MVRRTRRGAARGEQAARTAKRKEKKPPTPPPSQGGGGAAAPTPFEELAKKRGVNLAAERARAEAQIKAGKPIGPEAGPEAAEREKIQKAGGLGAEITLTSDQASRILAGTLKATSETVEAVKAGNITIQEQGPGEKFQEAGQQILSAAAILPVGRVAKLTKTGLSRGVGAGVGTGRELTNMGIAANTKTNKLINAAANKIVLSTGWKVAGSIGLGLIIAKEILTLTFGGKVFGQFLGMEEASQTVNIAGRDALINGNLEAAAAAHAARDEVLRNQTFWENVASYIPFKNVLDQLNKYREAAVVAATVYDDILEDKKLEAGGETEEERFRRYAEEEKADKKEVIDYNIQQLKLYHIWKSDFDKINQPLPDFKNLERKEILRIEARYIRRRREILNINQQSRAGNFSSLNFGMI